MTTAETSPDFPPKKISSHRDLIVWRKGIALAVECYQLARALPASERFIIKDQMMRAAVSIPSNIAEGQGQFSKGASYDTSALRVDRCWNSIHCSSCKSS